MPMERSDRRCSTCLYFCVPTEECRKSRFYVTRAPANWCSEGYWERHSEITSRLESYCFDDDAMTYDEQRYSGMYPDNYYAHNHKNFIPRKQFDELLDALENYVSYGEDTYDERLARLLITINELKAEVVEE